MKAISQANAPVAIEGDGGEMRMQELGSDPEPNRNRPGRGSSSTLWRRTALGAFPLALIREGRGGPVGGRSGNVSKQARVSFTVLSPKSLRNAR
jgi:hypothetical protein